MAAASNDDLRLAALIRSVANDGYRLSIDGSGREVVVTVSKLASDSMTWLDSRYSITRQCIELSTIDMYCYAINSAKAALDTRAALETRMDRLESSRAAGSATDD